MPDDDRVSDADREPGFRGEIAYRLGKIDEQLGKLVGRAEYEEAKKHFDTHIENLQEDVKDNRDQIVAVKGDITKLAEKQEKVKTRENDRRWLIVGMFFAPPVTILLNRLMETAIGGGP